MFNRHRNLSCAAAAMFITVTLVGPTPAPQPPQPTIDELRSLPYTSPRTDSPAKTGVVTNSRFAEPGYNFYSDRFHNSAALVTNDGRGLHTWSRPNSASWGHAELLPSGSLLVIENWDTTKKKEYPEEKGFQPRIVKLSARSEVEWVSHIPAHHDIQLLGDGTFLTLTERTRQINAVSKKNRTIDNGIAHVGANGKLLKEISLYRVMSRSPVKLKAVKPDDRGLIDLFHANSVQRFEQFPSLESLDRNLYKRTNVLFCSRHQDLIGIISEEGRLIWSWGQTELSGPHAARLLPNGRILVFDNGLGRKVSRIVEVDPRTNTITWTWQADPPKDFYSGTGGYVQRLPNGNTLITDSWQYSAFEVTPEPRIVWRFVNPWKTFMYRVHRYPLDYFDPTFSALTVSTLVSPADQRACNRLRLHEVSVQEADKRSGDVAKARQASVVGGGPIIPHSCFSSCSRRRSSFSMVFCCS